MKIAVKTNLKCAILSLILSTAFSLQASAHSHLLPDGSMPSLRNEFFGNKAGPCGPGSRNPNPTVLQPGQRLRVDWVETVDHPGYYRIAFSPGADLGYDQNVLLDKIPDNQGGPAASHTYSATVTVPSTPCTNCSIQLIQYMTETNPPSLYFSCADVEIRAGAPAASPKPVVPSVSPVPVADPNGGCE
jgi:hypothetical protein